MAVLKDLIVHGSSRFLNAAYYNKIDADEITTNTITLQKIAAKTNNTISIVAGLVDVDGELHTKSFTNSNIATIDGSFYITPTISLQGDETSGYTVSATTNSLSFSGTSYNLGSVYLDGSTSGTSAESAWSTGSAVIVTGEVLVNNEWIPLGTLKGTLSTYSANGTSIVINNILDSINHSSKILTLIAGTGNLPYRKVKISLVSINKSGLKSLGIYMTAVGANGKTFLDIYGGSLADTTSYGGLSTPVLRIGNLDGLPKVNNIDPKGWGIYTTNGFFSGTVVARQGKIGSGNTAWTIGNDSNTGKAMIYTGTRGSADSAYVSTGIGTESIGGSGTLNTTNDGYWAFTAGANFGVTTKGKLYATGGKIAGWTINTNDLSTGTAGSQSGIKFSNSTFTATINGASRSNLMMSIGSKFGVDRDGTLYANGANITNINASNISSNLLTAIQAVISNLSVLRADMGTITAGVIKHDTVGGSGGIWISAATDTSSNVTVGNSGAIKKWRLLVSNTFGVTSTGSLYATSADITGAIKATSFIAQDYNGSSYRDRVFVDTNGLTVFDGNGIQDSNIQARFGSTITLGKTTGQAAVINSNGMQIYNGGKQVANFGENVKIGRSDGSGSSMNIYPNSIVISNTSGADLFSIDIEGEPRSVESRESRAGQVVANAGNRRNYESTLAISASNGSEIKVNVVLRVGNNSTSFNWNVIKGTAYASGDDDMLTMTYDGQNIFTFTFQSYYSGYMGISIITTSIASTPSYTLGTREATNSKGAFSTTIGEGLIATGVSQTVIGQYNVADNDQLFIIGGGYIWNTGNQSTVVRDNVLTVDRNGNLKCNNIGQIPSPTNKTVNITSTNVDTYVEGATITLAAGGVYIIHAYASFPSNSTEAIRRVQIYNKTTSSALRTDSNYGRYYVTGDIMDIFKINGTTDLTYCTRVSAGVAINNVATYIKAIRIA